MLGAESDTPCSAKPPFHVLSPRFSVEHPLRMRLTEAIIVMGAMDSWLFAAILEWQFTDSQSKCHGTARLGNPRLTCRTLTPFRYFDMQVCTRLASNAIHNPLHYQQYHAIIDRLGGGCDSQECNGLCCRTSCTHWWTYSMAVKDAWGSW